MHPSMFSGFDIRTPDTGNAGYRPLRDLAGSAWSAQASAAFPMMLATLGLTLQRIRGAAHQHVTSPTPFGALRIDGQVSAEVRVRCF